MEKTLLNIKIDPKVKQQAQQVAKELGLPLGTIINAYLKELIREKRVIFSTPPTPNKKTQKILREIERDIKAGKNMSGPFTTYEEAMAYLHS
jgi:addiction module RelB/DinJ family antitoxin